MNHKLYEEWLFVGSDAMDEALTPQQSAELQTHLQNCPSCQRLAEAWRQTDLQLRRKPLVGPAAGFGARWQARLEADKKQLQQRQTFLALGFFGGSALLLLGSLLALFWPWLNSPEMIWWSGVYQAYTLFSYVNALQQAVGTASQTAFGLEQVVRWVFFVGMLCEMGVLWVVSFRMLKNVRRVRE